MRKRLIIGSRSRLVLLALSVTVAICAAGATAANRSRSYEDTLVFAYVGGTTQATFQECAIDGFSSKYHINVKYLVGASPGQNLALVAAQRSNPTIDVYIGSDSNQYVGTHHDFFARLPYSAIPNSKNIPAALRKSLRNGGFDKSGIPIESQLSGIEYNTKVFAEKGWAPPTSWRDLWDPKYHGHVALYGLLTANPQALVAIAAKLTGGNESHITKGLAQLRKMASPNLVYSSAALVDNGFQNGSVWIGQNTSARVYQGKTGNLPVEFVQPKEGVAILNQYADIVKNAPHPQAARLFINWLLRTDAQSCLAKAGFNPYNPKAAATVPKAKKLYTVPIGKVVKIDWNTVEHNLDSWLKLAPWLH